MQTAIDSAPAEDGTRFARPVTVKALAARGLAIQCGTCWFTLTEAGQAARTAPKLPTGPQNGTTLALAWLALGQTVNAVQSALLAAESCPAPDIDYVTCQEFADVAHDRLNAMYEELDRGTSEDAWVTAEEANAANTAAQRRRYLADAQAYRTRLSAEDREGIAEDVAFERMADAAN